MSDHGAAPVQLPRSSTRPLVALARRVAFAAFLVALVTAAVLLEPEGYDDAVDGAVSVLDAFYYATVSITTTGYGDITPVTDSARLLTAVVVTPARILFLIVLVGTTVEVLTDRWRQTLTLNRWRQRVRDHYVICGFGTTGQSAARSLRGQGVDPERIVVVEQRREGIEEASRAGLAAIVGDATRVAVLTEAHVDRACAVVIAPNRDDTAVLIALTARELSSDTIIVAAVREAENAHLLEQSGADSVITSAEASGRLLGLATRNARVAHVLEDLLRAGEGLDLVERDVEPAEVGQPAASVSDLLVVAVDREGELLRFDDPRCGALRVGDRLVGFRSASA
jgi:voltage-gated potassium channel